MITEALLNELEMTSWHYAVEVLVAIAERLFKYYEKNHVFEKMPHRYKLIIHGIIFADDFTFHMTRNYRLPHLHTLDTRQNIYFSPVFEEQFWS